MDAKKIQTLLNGFKKEDKMLNNLMVYDRKNKKLIASTVSAAKAKQVIKIAKIMEEADKRTALIDKPGKLNWDMASFARKVVVFVRIHGEIFLDVSYRVEKAPSGAIEDALELALMVGELI